jgi:hypothetical protein
LDIVRLLRFVNHPKPVSLIIVLMQQSSGEALNEIKSQNLTLNRSHATHKIVKMSLDVGAQLQSIVLKHAEIPGQDDIVAYESPKPGKLN